MTKWSLRYCASCSAALFVAVLVASVTAQRGEVMPSTMRIAKDLPVLQKTSWQAMRPEDVRAAYEFAARHPEVMRYVPCFCGCNKHYGHGSSEDCFVASRAKDGRTVSWNQHGQVCAMCLAIGLEARRAHMAGQTVSQIRLAIDKRYSEFADRTPTPTPSNHGHPQ